MAGLLEVLFAFSVASLLAWLLSSGSAWAATNWAYNPIHYYRVHLQGCVADGNCPAKESAAHRGLEWLQWQPIKYLGTPGAVLSFVLFGMIAWVLLMVDALVVHMGFNQRKPVFFP